MSNKCPKCGFKYGEFDIYCSRCGNKLNLENKKEKEIIKEEIDNSKRKKEAEKPSVHEEISFENPKILAENLKNLIEIPAVRAGIFILVLMCFFTFALNVFLQNHNYNKGRINFENLIANPQKIPLLKESSGFFELKQDIINAEKFLTSYLKYSNDSMEKKMEIFASFLNETDKLSHIVVEDMTKGEIKECDTLIVLRDMNMCAQKLNKEFKNTPIAAYADSNGVYLYSNSNYIRKTFSKYLTNDMNEYMNLKSKYNSPVSLGLSLKISAKSLANRIYDFEKIYAKTKDENIKEQVQKIMYDDFKKFIFTPSIYATTTQEMKLEFKRAYLYYIRTKKQSQLRPVVMSYMDKKRNYTEENLANDYPYKMYAADFKQNIDNSSFKDIFATLRKNIFNTNNAELALTYVYNRQNGTFYKYNSATPLSQSEFVLGEVDENNNIAIYDNTFSPLQELNIQKYSKLYLLSGGLYAYNKNKLTLARVMYNGKIFNMHTLSKADITSIFPGIEVIDIDTYNSYNILIEKPNKKQIYIIISRYGDNWAQYSLEPFSGSILTYALPNMFAVDSFDDTVIAFRNSELEADSINESSPAYKFTIHTLGQKSKNTNLQFASFDEKTAEQKEEELHTPNIMPKINKKDEEKENKENTDKDKTEQIQEPPSQNIDPPVDYSDDD